MVKQPVYDDFKTFEEIFGGKKHSNYYHNEESNYGYYGNYSEFSNKEIYNTNSENLENKPKKVIKNTTGNKEKEFRKNSNSLMTEVRLEKVQKLF